MESLDLWIEFVYSQDEAFDKYLLDVEMDENIVMRPVRYNVNTECWSFYSYPRLDVFSFLHDIYNVMLF